MYNTIGTSYQYELEFHMLFIHFKQAFYSICRQKLIEEMVNMEIPEKLIRITKLITEKSRVKIITKEGHTWEIQIRSEVR